MRRNYYTGQVLFALSFAALGALILVFPDFGQAWQTVPKAYPSHRTLELIYGAVLLASCIGVLVPQIARPAALALTVWLLLRLLLVKFKIVLAHPDVPVVYEDFSESLAHVVGAWLIFSLLPRQGGVSGLAGNVRAGQILFALATIPFGLSHFLYMNMTAPIIPSFIPFHVPLAYFTGAAHIAAGLGMLFGGFIARSLPRLAATLEAVMVGLFTVLVWPPMLIAAPDKLSNWSEFFVSATIAGAAWLVASSYGEKA